MQDVRRICLKSLGGESYSFSLVSVLIIFWFPFRVSGTCLEVRMSLNKSKRSSMIIFLLVVSEQGKFYPVPEPYMG